MSLHICHVSTVHKRIDTRVFVKQCSSIVTAGHQCSLVIADGLGNETKNGVQIHDLGASGGRLSRALVKSIQVMRYAANLNADVYHIHDPELIPVFCLLRLRGRTVIYDMHEDLHRQVLRKHWIPKPIANSVAWFAKLLEKTAAKTMSGLVTVTPLLTDRFASSAKRVTEVRNYPLSSEFASLSTDDYTNRAQSVLYVGGISLDRGIDTMLDALATLPDVTLHLGGKFSNGELQSYCQQHPAWQQVQFHGWCSREQIVDLAKRCRVGLVVLKPTGDYEDALPVKMFEYMAAGLPVIASDFPLWRSVVEPSHSGLLVDPKDPGAVADAIRHCMSNPVEAKEMGEHGQAAIASTYNWQQQMNKLLDLYKSLT